jgi:hypothetical protein
MANAFKILMRNLNFWQGGEFYHLIEILDLDGDVSK